MTAAELMAKLQNDPEHQAKQAAQEDARVAQQLAWKKAEEPLVAELKQAGLDIASVWDLVNQAAPYPAAIPVLLNHLPRDYPDRVREGIGRALAVPESRTGWRVLVEAFVTSTDTTATGSKWGIACALGAAGDDECLDEALELIGDPKHGENRVPLLDILARSSEPKAKAALKALSSDPVLGQSAKDALKSSRA